MSTATTSPPSLSASSIPTDPTTASPATGTAPLHGLDRLGPLGGRLGPANGRLGPLGGLFEHSDDPARPDVGLASGDPGPLFGSLAQSPELYAVVLPFIEAALGPTGAPERLKEIAILRTSANLSCRYCTDIHTVAAVDAGLTLDEVTALRQDPRAAYRFADRVEQVVVTWVDAASTSTGAVPDALASIARRTLGDRRVMELTVTVGATALLNRIATALRLPTSPETLARLASLGFVSGAPTSPALYAWGSSLRQDTVPTFPKRPEAPEAPEAPTRPSTARTGSATPMRTATADEQAGAGLARLFARPPVGDLAAPAGVRRSTPLALRPGG
jgi:AhpD family alkylhydroperoxidase